jgi:capsular exopolysaccharide synthesis family protein
MDTIDSPDSKLPVPYSAALPPASVSGLPVHHELAVPSAPHVNTHVILRGLIRHWWRILLIWLAISAPTVYWIYSNIEPTYEAFGLLHFEPTRPILFDPSRDRYSDLRGIERYLQTQVNLITSDAVLREAVANPTVVNLPKIKQSKDSKADLRKTMVVEIVQEADLIRIALESTDPNEAAKIVQSVVDSYMTHNAALTQGANKKLRASLDTQATKLTKQIEDVTKKLKADLAQKDSLELKEAESPNPSKKEQDLAQPTVSKLTEGQYNHVIAELFQTDIDLIGAEALLEAKRDASKSTEEEIEQRSQELDKQLEARIQEEFLKDPDVVALKNEIDEAEKQLKHTKKVARLSNDPARRAAEEQCLNLRTEYEELWKTKYDEIHQRLVAEVTGPQPRETISELELKVKLLKKKKDAHKKLLEQLKVDRKATNNDTFIFAYENHELTSLVNAREQVRSHLQQVDFEASHEPYHVSLVDSPAIPQIPSHNKRIKYMAYALVGVLFLALGLFLLLEVKAQRVADPDHLSTRIRSEVYALPPLPTARSMRKLSTPEADDHIEQFIQRLDHVRFAVCNSSTESGKGRCVLITSAIGGEGKTTLAAQLAARCGNAGMSTLLIDADLRRAALCPLLDVPEGPGLSDVLKDEATIEEVVIRVQGGTFNLLPAGTPVHDTSRVLEARKFGLLIAQLRQLYDLIIIDSPPVIPVPDALILGRWADGAVLAARYDISRFPQVERARRQLDSAGIAVLGTVINGMRNTSSYYGRYTYSRRQSPQPNSSNTI